MGHIGLVRPRGGDPPAPACARPPAPPGTVRGEPEYPEEPRGIVCAPRVGPGGGASNLTGWGGMPVVIVLSCVALMLALAAIATAIARSAIARPLVYGVSFAASMLALVAGLAQLV